ncbi:Zn(2)-C6 fungal-type domain-containing protein [Favolaschia claudopus]|uniref:Zn(2)-C6 fungal-type domain-containing protein n=1 Tax=Favolaschia claudopus TaxID=2862362 RepID=A0AAV9ZB14_9AGAR
MSDDDERPGDLNANPTKKRRVQRACDACRRKKRACDGLRRAEKKCTNCVESGVACTFAGALAKRRSYVEALEARLELTEQLLRKVSQRDSPNSTESSSSPGTSSSSRWSPKSPVLQNNDLVVSTASGSTSPSVMLAALNIRSMNTAAPAPHGDDLAHVELVEEMGHLTLNQVRNRFQGKSSEAMLVKAAVQMREGYEERDMPWNGRRMHYWTYNPFHDRIPPAAPDTPPTFPPPDLLADLTSCYFTHKNIYFPVLHRPTFERALASNLHLRDSAFGAVVLLVCAIGARFSDDPRLNRDEKEKEEPLRRGWEFFDQVPFGLDHIFETPGIYLLQYYCLAVAFLENSTPAAAWSLIGIGLRIAQDVGAHRHSNDGPPSVDSELWKRAFWVLVSYDRQVSMALGRSCATQYEDVDAQFPIECDDEYFENADDPSLAFVQPAGKPSLITFFNCYLRLNNVLAFGLKMLYSLNKTKRLLAYRDPAWEEHIVAEIDSALNGWLDGIPAHLRQERFSAATNSSADSPPTEEQAKEREREDIFFDQSVLLYCSYYNVQMSIHRPFIPTIRKGEPTSLPSLAICTNAARSCSHVADISRLKKGDVPVPVIINSVFTSGVILLLNIWSGKRTGLPPHLNSAISEVQKCMAVMKNCEKMWQTAGIFYDLLEALAAVGEVPLPPADSTTAYPLPHSFPLPAAQLKNKRPREESQEPEHPPPPSAPQPVHYPPSDDGFSLPTYTADLGKLPVFYSRSPPPVTSKSTWYPTQGASPLGRPEFVVGGGAEGAGNGTGHSLDASVGSVLSEESLFTSGAAGVGSGVVGGGGYPFGFGFDFPGMPNGGGVADGGGVGMVGDGMNIGSDVMAMWANTPASFEVGDWGIYLNLMSDLNGGMDGPAPPM